MQFAFTFATADPLLGRIDYSSLSDQTRMELLVADLSDITKSSFQDLNESFTDFADWWIVKAIEEGHPVSLSFDQGIGYRRTVEGMMDFSYIPPSVKAFSLRNYSISGSLDTSRLPTNLESFNVQGNALTSTIDLRALPPKLFGLNAKRNQLTGSCHLDALPQTLTLLDLSVNQLSGSILLDALPPMLGALHLNSNQFSGSISLAKLPVFLEKLILSSNAISGEFALVDPPSKLRIVSVERTEIGGCATVPPPESVRVYLGHTKITKVVDEDGVDFAPLQYVFDNFFQAYMGDLGSPMYVPGGPLTPDGVWSPNPWSPGPYS